MNPTILPQVPGERPDILQGSFGSPRAGLRNPSGGVPKAASQNHNKLCPTPSHGSLKDSDEVKAKYNVSIQLVFKY